MCKSVCRHEWQQKYVCERVGVHEGGQEWDGDACLGGGGGISQLLITPPPFRYLRHISIALAKVQTQPAGLFPTRMARSCHCT